MLIQMFRATLQREVVIEGRGLFSGEDCRALLRPSSSPGIVFLRDGQRIEASPATYIERPNCTVLGSAAAEVAVTEHLLAALWAAEIDSAEIEVTGPELPSQDGSALPMYEALQAGGLSILGEKPALRRSETGIRIEDGDSSISWDYDEELSIEFEFSHAELGRQFFRAESLTRAFARSAILPARTFITDSEAQIAMAAGLLRNTHEEDALLIRGGQFSSPLRFPDEFARHKTLDLIGDLYVLPFELTGRIAATRSGHKLNRALARKLWEMNQ